MITSEISQRLTAMDLAPTGYKLMRNFQPDTPDRILCLTETVGLTPSQFFSGEPIEGPSLQLVARDAPGESDKPRLALEKIYQSMLDWGAFLAPSTGTRYIQTIIIQPPFLLKRDANERVYFAFNVLFLKEKSPTT